MKKPLIVSLIVCFLSITAYAEPFKGEASLITASGLTDKYDPKDIETYKKIFGEKVKTIKYWVDFSKDTGGIGSIQSVEWFSPDGALWFKETNDFFDLGTLFMPKILENVYALSTKNIPHGVWVVRFIWNDNLIEQHYFSYGTNKEPSESEIVNLSNLIQKHDELVKIIDKAYDFKISSYLLADFSHYFGQQKIYQSTFYINPKEKATYLLNVYGGDMVVSPMVFLYIFSPDGKIYMKNPMPIARASGSVNYYARFKKNIQLDAEKDAPIGTWKLVTYYVNEDKIIDEKYFYFGGSKNMLLTKKSIDDLENKIDKNSIFDSLPNYAKNEVIKYRQTNQERMTLKIKNGMSKEDVLELLGKPNRTDLNRYDDAEIWLYDDVEKSVANAIKNSGRNYQILHGTGNVSRDLVGGVVYTIIGAGIGTMLANRLEIVIKNNKVVASKGKI